MLIVLEGLDGAGKSTQVRKIKQYITSRGRELRYLHFPRFDAPVVGEMLAKFLRGDFGKIDEVHPMLVALLFAEDRRDASVLMRKWLQQGDVVLLDRYVYSNIAFQCAKISDAEEAKNLRKWILDSEFGEYHLPLPDLNLFLDVPIDFVNKKLQEERHGNDREYLHGKSDIHEADIHFQMKVREIYLAQTSLDPSFLRINCSGENGEMLSPEGIFEKIRCLIDKSLQ